MAEARWEFRDNDALTWREPGTGRTVARFDPFPCYPHDWTAADRELAAVAARWPLPWDLNVWLADRETISRTNGFSCLARDHTRRDDEDDDGPAGTIVLNGKRIPPHPAVTRYLIGHEYGHHAQWSINWRNGAPYACTGDAAREYAKIRNLPDSALEHADGGRWHASVHEIMACDFRVLVCEIEPDYWPHPGTCPPHMAEGLQAWWDEQQYQARQAAA
jgi:hypothetical protein